jgi:hypothetical protein
MAALSSGEQKNALAAWVAQKDLRLNHSQAFLNQISLHGEANWTHDRFSAAGALKQT